jgi:hypothetical protein
MGDSRLRSQRIGIMNLTKLTNSIIFIVHAHDTFTTYHDKPASRILVFGQHLVA